MVDDFKTQNEELIDPLVTPALLDATDDDVVDVLAPVGVEDPTLIETNASTEDEDMEGFESDFFNNEGEE